MYESVLFQHHRHCPACSAVVSSWKVVLVTTKESKEGIAPPAKLKEYQCQDCGRIWGEPYD